MEDYGYGRKRAHEFMDMAGAGAEDMGDPWGGYTSRDYVVDQQAKMKVYNQARVCYIGRTTNLEFLLNLKAIFAYGPVRCRMRLRAVRNDDATQTILTPRPRSCESCL